MGDRQAETLSVFGKTLNPDGSLRAVSPSQVSSFKACPLKWHFEKKSKLAKKPMGKGAAIGDAAHDRTKIFLKTGQDVRGPLELEGAGMLAPYLWAAPFNKGPGLVEEPLIAPRLVTPGGILITGYFDYYIPGAPATGHTPGRWPVVIDHKFKKDLAKWAPMTEAARAELRAGRVPTFPIEASELADDPQAIIYPAWSLTREPDAPGVEFRHHNHQTEGEGGRFPLPVFKRMTRDEVLAKWGALASMIDGPMREVAARPAAMPGETPEGIPFNIDACGNFGGCDFARTCSHSPQNRFVAALRSGQQAVSNRLEPTNKGTNPMGLLAQINAPPQVSQPPPPAPAVAGELLVSQAQPESIYVLPGGPVGRFIGMVGSRPVFRLKDGGLKEVEPVAIVRAVDAATVALFEGRATSAGVPVTPEPVKEEKARKLGIVYVDQQQVNPVAPPDVSKEVAAPIPAPAPIVQTPPPEVKVTTAEALATAANSIPVGMGQAAAEAPSAPKRGRPTNAELAARRAAEDMAARAGVAPGAVVAGLTQAEPEGGKLFLLIDCACNRATDLSGYVAKLAADVAARFQAPDVRLGHKNSDLGFGGWKALLALEAAKNPPKGLCSITSSELADPVIEALTPIAAVVVRGGVR